MIRGITSKLDGHENIHHPTLSPEVLDRAYENLSGVIKANAAKFQCGALIAHASGLNRTHPLRKTTWYRLIFDRPLRRNIPSRWQDFKDPVDIDGDETLPLFSSVTSPGRDEAMLRRAQSKLNQLLKKDTQTSIKEVVDFLDQEIESKPEASRLAKALILWIKGMLQAPADERYQPSSIYGEINRIWRAVLTAESEGCPESNDKNGWGVFLSSAFFQLASRKTAFKAVASLKSFHKFLVQEQLAPELNYKEIEGFDTTGESFDPNIVTPREYRQALLYISASIGENARLARICKMVTMLGFRCGLRREEVRFLEIRSIEPGDRPLLVVEDTPRRTLKTASGNRRIPLYVLLEPEELDDLISYTKERRSKAQGQTQRLLFILDDDSDEPLTDWKLFEPIQQALRAASGDRHLVFHHLRHAFVNWLLIRLLMSQSPSFRDSRFAVLKDEMFSPAACAQIRSGIYQERTGGAMDPGARDIYAVALLVGHSSPAITLKSYFHLADWLVSKLSQDEDALLPQKVASNFLGISLTKISILRQSDRKAPSNSKHGISIEQLNTHLAKDGAFSDLYADDVTLPVVEGMIFHIADNEFEIECLEKTRAALSASPPNIAAAIENLVKALPALGEIQTLATELINIPLETLEKWIARANSMEPVARTVRPFKLIASPHQKEEHDDFIALLHEIGKKNTDVKKLLTDRIREWLQAFDPTTGAFRFGWNERRATEFMELLHDLSISPKNLLIRIQVGRSCDEGLRHQAVSKLMKIFSVEERQIRIKNNGSKISELQNTDTEIFFVHSKATPVETIRIGNLIHGYRYALSACVIFRELLEGIRR